MRIEALVAATRVVRTSRVAVAGGLAFLAASAVAAVHLGPFAVELPALALSVPPAAIGEPALASRPPAEPPVKVAAGRHRIRHTVVARRAEPAAETSVVAVRDTPAAPEVTESTYYVFYWDGGGARWIRIVWVQAVPDRPPLNGA
jgi:hypothetical protein